MSTEQSDPQEERSIQFRRRAIRLTAIVLFLAVVTAFCSFEWQRHHGAGSAMSGISAGPNPSGLTPQEALSALVPREKPRKVVYPYSIIPGGVHSVAELKAAMAKDPVVSAQYAAFKIEYARIMRLDRDRKMHVNYRRGDDVYWTQREVSLSKGEMLITDGSRTALLRCGNLISDDIAEPANADEPTEAELFTPVPIAFSPGDPVSDDRFPEFQLAENPNAPPSVTNISPIGGSTPTIVLPSGPLPYPHENPPPPPNPHIVKTPEPGSAYLLLAGLMAFFLMQIARPKLAFKKEN
jgi:hypothetical protein